MDTSVYSSSSITNEQINKLITEKKSFTITDIPKHSFGKTVKTIESLIETQGLSCRIYTAGRIAAMGAASAWSLIGGIAAGLAIAAHTVATYNPEYEIAKYQLSRKLIITHKKN